MRALRHAGTYSEYLTSEGDRTYCFSVNTKTRKGRSRRDTQTTAAAKDRQKVEEGEWVRRANSIAQCPTVLSRTVLTSMEGPSRLLQKDLHLLTSTSPLELQAWPNDHWLTARPAWGWSEILTACLHSSSPLSCSETTLGFSLFCLSKVL